MTCNLRIPKKSAGTTMTTRRNFIKSSAIIAASLPLIGNKILASPLSSAGTGIALYTIRDAMGKDPAAALAEVAEMGFDWVEAADYNDGRFYKLKPKEFSKMVKRTGLDLISTHSGISPANEDVFIEDTAEAGFKYLILPSLPHEWNSNLDGYKKAADFFNRVGEKCRKSGLKFGFHNHQIEFAEISGKIPFDILLDETNPKYVIFEMDIAWITAADNDPLVYFRKHPGRFELWHLKDLTPEKQDTTLGEGIIDFKPILSRSKQAGMKYWFIEQDNCHTHTPMESISISRKYFFEKLR